MTALSQPQREVRTKVFSAVGLLVLTSVHHAYGALLYHTAWRFHVVLIAMPMAAVIMLLARSGNSTLRAGAAALILVFPVLLIGIFEGGYNHLVKNIVYFAAGSARARAMFPPPMYELPGDLLFEITGIAQFLFVPFAALEAFKILRADRQANV